MIHEVDAAIRTLVKRDAFDGDDVEVAFEVPTKEWAAKRNAPTLNVYLYDIREDLTRRRMERELVRDEDGNISGRRRPPRRFKLSYLITAWTQRPEDEHRLLSGVLSALLPHEELPRAVLEGSLAEQPSAVIATIGVPPPQDRSIGEIWTAIGGELKPSLDLVIIAPVPVEELRHAGPLVLEEPRFAFEGADGELDGDGPAARRRGRRGQPPEEEAASRTVPATEETVRGGKGDEGRVFTITTDVP